MILLVWSGAWAFAFRTRAKVMVKLPERGCIVSRKHLEHPLLLSSNVRRGDYMYEKIKVKNTDAGAMNRLRKGIIFLQSDLLWV